MLLGVEAPAAPGQFFTDKNTTHHVKAETAVPAGACLMQKIGCNVRGSYCWGMCVLTRPSSQACLMMSVGYLRGGNTKSTTTQPNPPPTKTFCPNPSTPNPRPPPHSLPSLVVMRRSRRNNFARKFAGRHLDANEVFGEVAAELACGVV